MLECLTDQRDRRFVPTAAATNQLASELEGVVGGYAAGGSAGVSSWPWLAARRCDSPDSAQFLLLAEHVLMQVLGCRVHLGVLHCRTLESPQEKCL